MPETIYIYSLKDPRDRRVRYIGKTNNLTRRYEQHRYSSGECRRERWLRGLFDKKMKPVMEVIEECTAEEWKEKERYWIAFYRLLEDDLLNVSDGGEHYTIDEKARDQFIRGIAMRRGVSVRNCHNCGGLTMAKNAICTRCLRELSHDFTDEWVKFYKHDYDRERHDDLRNAEREILSGLLEDMEEIYPIG